MTRGGPLVAMAVGVVLLLALGVRLTSWAPSDDGDASFEERVDDRRGRPADAAVPEPRQAANRPAVPRRRLPPRVPASERGASPADDAARGSIAGIDAPPVTDRELPAGEWAQPAAQPDADADGGAVAEPAGDVLYDTAQRTFDTTARVEIDAGASMADAGTMAFWVQPAWEEGNGDRASFIELGETGFRIVKDGNHLRFEYTDANGDNALGGAADLSAWPAGEWHHVAATWEQGTLVLYVDGQRVASNQPAVPPPLTGRQVIAIGSAATAGGAPVAPAQVANLTVMKRPLTSAEILERMASGPPDQSG